MKIDKALGDTIKVALIEEREISVLKIKDEGTLVTYDPQNEGEKPVEKLVIQVTFDGQSKNDPFKWSMNNKSRNALIDKWGSDTEKWIGKEAEINVNGEGKMKHITVDPIRTKA